MSRAPPATSLFAADMPGLTYYARRGMVGSVANGEVGPKPVVWIGSVLEDLRGFPKEGRKKIGDALRFAQLGQKHPAAKPLKGFGGAGVLEIVEDVRGDAYRAVYTVRFAGILYALHAFQKKSTRGIATPRRHVELIRKRLEAARQDYRARKGDG